MFSLPRLSQWSPCRNQPLSTKQVCVHASFGFLPYIGQSVPISVVYEHLRTELEKKDCGKELPADTIAMFPGSRILKMTTSQFQAAAFPHIFVCGELGTYCQQPGGLRQRMVSFKKDTQHRLCMYQAPERTDFMFQVAAYDSILQTQLFTSISIQLAKMSSDQLEKIKDITVGDLEKVINEREMPVYGSKISELNRNLRFVGEHAEFSQLFKSAERREAKSMIVALGAFQLYITLTPADAKNPLAFVFTVHEPKPFDQEDPDLTNAYIRSSLAASNPTGLAEFFAIYVRELFAKLFGWENPERRGIFGKLKGYRGQNETQGRGTLHMHALLWLLGAPSPVDVYERCCSDPEFRKAMLGFISTIIKGDEKDISLDFAFQPASSPTPTPASLALSVEETSQESVCIDPPSVAPMDTTSVDTSTVSTPLHEQAGFALPDPPEIVSMDISLPSFSDPPEIMIPAENNLLLVDPQLVVDAERRLAYSVPPDPNHPDFREMAARLLILAAQTYQHHSHTDSCYKNGAKECRYRKPAQTFPEATFEESTGVFHVKKSDGMMNNMNYFFTLMIEANTDLQYVASGFIGLCILHYITMYITKFSVGIDNLYILQKAALESIINRPVKTTVTGYSSNQLHARSVYLRFFRLLQGCTQVNKKLYISSF